MNRSHSRSRWLGWLVPTLLLGSLAYAIAEEITLTTYYPSPRGVYDQLRTAGNVQFGTIVPPGEPGGPPDPPPRVYVAQDATPDPFDDPATLVAPALRVDRRNSDETLSPLLVINRNSRVGIGTDDPQAALDVRGDLAVSGTLTTGSSRLQLGSGTGVVLSFVTGANPPPPCPEGHIFLARKWVSKTCQGDMPCDPSAPPNQCTTAAGWAIDPEHFFHNVPNAQGPPHPAPVCLWSNISGVTGECIWLSCEATNWTEAVCIGN